MYLAFAVGGQPARPQLGLQVLIIEHAEDQLGRHFQLACMAHRLLPPGLHLEVTAVLLQAPVTIHLALGCVQDGPLSFE